MKRLKAFVLIEILISGIILATTIGVSMYLFRLGLNHLQRSEEILLLNSKIIQAINFIKANSQLEGINYLGDGYILKWKAEPLAKSFVIVEGAQNKTSYFIYLYKVSFSIEFKNQTKQYQIFMVKYQKER